MAKYRNRQGAADSLPEPGRGAFPELSALRLERLGAFLEPPAVLVGDGARDGGPERARVERGVFVDSGDDLADARAIAKRCPRADGHVHVHESSEVHSISMHQHIYYACPQIIQMQLLSYCVQSHGVAECGWLLQRLSCSEGFRLGADTSY